VIYNIISRLYCRKSDNIFLKFQEDTFVKHEFYKTNSHINLSFEHENNAGEFTQTIIASILREGISGIGIVSGIVSDIVSNPLGKFMYIHAHLLHSVNIDKDYMTKRATALCRHVHKIRRSEERKLIEIK